MFFLYFCSSCSDSLAFHFSNSNLTKLFLISLQVLSSQELYLSDSNLATAPGSTLNLGEPHFRPHLNSNSHTAEFSVEY